MVTENDSDMDSWQSIMDLGYLMDGEGTKLWRRKLQDAVEWIDANPVDPHGSDENFKRYAVMALIKTFAVGPMSDEQREKLLDSFGPAITDAVAGELGVDADHVVIMGRNEEKPN